MYWDYSIFLSLLSLLAFFAVQVSGTVIVLPYTDKNLKKCQGSDNCGTGTTYCDAAFYKLVSDREKSNLCASNYLGNIENCKDFTCFFKFIPKNLCKCDTDINTVYNCTDLGSSPCILKFRSWKTTCDLASYCVANSISQIMNCDEKTFTSCVQNIVTRTNCSTEFVNYVYEPSESYQYFIAFVGSLILLMICVVLVFEIVIKRYR